MARGVGRQHTMPETVHSAQLAKQVLRPQLEGLKGAQAPQGQGVASTGWKGQCESFGISCRMHGSCLGPIYLFLFYFFEMVSPSVALAGLELIASDLPLPLLSKC